MNVNDLHDDRDEIISSPLFARARRNIETKLAIIRGWISNDGIPWSSDDEGVPIRDKDGELILDYFPRDIKSFASWDGSQNCAFVRANIDKFIAEHGLVKIRSLGRKTLYQPYHADLDAQVRAALKTIISLAEQQIQKYNKTNQINSLQAALQYFKDLREQQDTETAQFRNELREYKNKERQAAIKREEGDQEYEKIIGDLKQQNAALVRTLSKLTPLHVPERHDSQDSSE
jgi:hypothetical protein